MFLPGGESENTDPISRLFKGFFGLFGVQGSYIGVGDDQRPTAFIDLPAEGSCPFQQPSPHQYVIGTGCFYRNCSYLFLHDFIHSIASHLS